MTQAVAYRNGTSGQEESSSGLIIHRGPLTAALVRAIGSQGQNTAIFPRDGQGSGSSMELGHYPKNSSFIQSYDRDTSQWLPLWLNAKDINLNPQGGKVNFPQYSTEALLGAWFNPSGFAPPQAGVWTETDVRASFTTTGSNYPWRMCFATAATINTGCTCYFGLGYDGSCQWPSMQLVQNTTPNALILSASGTMFNYTTIPTPGIHRVSIWMYCGGSPVPALHGGMYTSLFVTEMRA